jgi:hypothetical protein
MKTLTHITASLGTLLAPAIAFAQTSIVGGIDSSGGWFFGIGSGGGFGGAGFACADTICLVATRIIYVINFVLVPLIFAIAFIVFLWGIFRYYIAGAADEASRSKGHQLILWGIIGFVVMISLWGLVNIVANTFGLAGYYAPPTPRSTF